MPLCGVRIPLLYVNPPCGGGVPKRGIRCYPMPKEAAGFMPQDEKWMRLALDAARVAAEAGEVPVGAVVVQGAQLLSVRGNAREETGDPTAHAEMLALREAAGKIGRWNLSGCTLYATLEPCPMCAGAISQAHLSRVVYGAFDAKYGACGSASDLRPLSPGTKFQGGLLHEPCAQILRDFFRLRRKDPPHIW